MIFSGYPDHTFLIRLASDGVDQTIYSNKMYLRGLIERGWNSNEIDFELTIQLRKCIPGEQFTDAGKCDECDDSNSYSLIHMVEPGSCISCPTLVAICRDGDKIGPKAGYWRKSNATDNFIKCFN